jgi:NAD(P)-dependent dehydrogenase (short-subunit alcohol dehydrogenase family)
VFYPSQQAAAHMGANQSGHIVNITAGIAMQPNAKVPALLPILIKGGLNNATRGLAIELAASNVKVNAVAPASSPRRCTARTKPPRPSSARWRRPAPPA